MLSEPGPPSQANQSPGVLLKMQILTPRVWGGARRSIFLTGSRGHRATRGTTNPNPVTRQGSFSGHVYRSPESPPSVLFSRGFGPNVKQFHHTLHTPGDWIRSPRRGLAAVLADACLEDCSDCKPSGRSRAGPALLKFLPVQPAAPTHAATGGSLSPLVGGDALAHSCSTWGGP